jgi:hypothetical protein
LGAIYALKNSVTYTNPSLPFGPNAKDSISAYYVYNTISIGFDVVQKAIDRRSHGNREVKNDSDASL